MTKSGLSFIGALMLFVAGLLVVPAPSSANTFGSAKSPILSAQQGDLHLTDGGSWKKKKSFKRKKHYRGDRYYGAFDNHKYRGHKKKKYRRAYRYGYNNGYDDGYYDGRRDRRYYGGGYYSRHYGFGNRFRGRGYSHRGHRYGSGYIRTPGFYFRF